MTTPHINAKVGDFAETVLMPGDPLRAKFIADNFLEDAQQVNDVRNMLGYTGYYKGTRVSVMGSGMGIPTTSIYAHELINEYGVKNIVRVGTCGGIHPDIKLRDIIIAMGACTDSGVNRTRIDGYDFSAIADYELLEKTVNAARNQGATFYVGNIFSADLFYGPDLDFFRKLASLGILGVEMEAAGLYGVAAANGAKALTIATVSDLIFSGEKATSEERQTTFTDMMTIALNAVTQD